MSWTSIVSALAGVVIASSSLVVSIVALRLTREQARAYLFPVPAVFVTGSTPANKSISMRNFGAGAMLGIWAEIHLWSPGSKAQIIKVDFPALAAGEEIPILDSSKTAGLAISRIDIQISYKNIQGASQAQKFRLSATDLGSLEN